MTNAPPRTYLANPSAILADDPYPIYKKFRDEAPVYWDEESQCYMLTRYDDIESVLLDHERFSNISLPLLNGDVPRLSPLIERDQPQHTFLREMLMPLFTPASIRARNESFRAIAVELCDEAEQQDTVDAHSEIAIPLPGIVTMDVIGLPRSSSERFLALTAERLTRLSDRNNPPPDARPWEEIQADLWDVARPAVEERRREPQNDLISVLVAAQEKYGDERILDDFLFDQGFIIDMLLHIMTGGFHTTQHLIELLIDFYADHHEMWQRIRDDRKLIDVAIEEMLRLEAPVQALRRRAKEDVVIRDVTIPKDSNVIVVYGSANHDERVFEDPDSYSLDRPPKRHMTFSLGIHYCPGAPVSRAEVKGLMNEMLDRYPVIERMGPSKRDPTTFMRGWGEVPVRLRRG